MGNSTIKAIGNSAFIEAKISSNEEDAGAVSVTTHKVFAAGKVMDAFIAGYTSQRLDRVYPAVDGAKKTFVGAAGVGLMYNPKADGFRIHGNANPVMTTLSSGVEFEKGHGFVAITRLAIGEKDAPFGATLSYSRGLSGEIKGDNMFTTGLSFRW